MSPKRWPSRLRTAALSIIITCLTVSGISAIAGSIIVDNHMGAISNELQTEQQTEARNYLFQVMAGVKLNDGSKVGKLAAALRATIASSQNPAQSLLHFYVGPNQYPQINEQLGLVVINYETVTDDKGNPSTLDQGYVARSFLGYAWETTNPANVTSLLTPPRAPEAVGLLSWRNDIYLSAAPLVLGLLALLGIFLTWPIYAATRKRRRLAQAPAEAREVQEVIRKLSKMPGARDSKSKVGKALAEARKTYDWMLTELPHERTEATLQSQLRDLREQLNQIETSEREGLRVERELGE